MGDQPHASAASTPGKDPVPIVQEAGWATGPVWTGGKLRPHRDSITDHPARSQTLYRLSYPDHQKNKKKIQEFLHTDTTNVEPEMYDYTSNNCSHWNSNEKPKEKLEAVPGKHSIDSLQKTAILGTSHRIRKVLQCEA